MQRSEPSNVVASLFLDHPVHIGGYRGDGESPRLVADWPRLEAERGVKTVDSMNAVGADVSHVETPVASAGGQVGAVS